MFSKNKKWMAFVLPLVTAVFLTLSSFAYRKAEENSQLSERMAAGDQTKELTTMEMRTTELAVDRDGNIVTAGNDAAYGTTVQELGYIDVQEEQKQAQTDARNY